MAGGAATGMGSNAGAAANPFNQASQAQMAAIMGTQGAMGAASNMNPWAFSQGSQGYKATPMGDAAGYRAVQQADPELIKQAAQGYYDPYANMVVNRTTSNMQNALDEQLTGLGGAAASAGAFGGARHGLTEARAMSETNRAIGDMTAQLKSNQFNTAMGLGAQDVTNQLGVNSANQSAANTARQFNKGAENQFSLVDQAARDAAKQFGKTAANTAGGANADRAASMWGANQGNVLSAASQLAGLGNQSFGYGQQINQNLANDGAQAQGVNQALMGQAAGMFDSYLNQGMNALNTRISSLSLNPLNNAGTQTQQTTGLPSQGGGAMGVLGSVLPMFLK